MCLVFNISNPLTITLQYDLYDGRQLKVIVTEVNVNIMFTTCKSDLAR